MFGNRFVARTFPHVETGGPVRGQQAIGQENRIGVVRRVIEVEFSPDPVPVAIIRTVPIVGRNPVVVISGVHNPGKTHLLEIVQTVDALRLGLGLRQRRQEHPREDRAICESQNGHRQS